MAALTPSSAPQITVSRLSKKYADAWALDGLDLEVGPGEIVGLLGPNGAGKTTALEILCALRRPTSGSVEVAGADPTRDPSAVRARIGTVLQTPALDGVATARESLTLQARLRGVPARRARAEADAALDRAGLAEMADKRIATLSGGQRRRVDLATAVIGHPRVLILDEPTAGLDPASRRALWEQVRELAGEGVAVLLSTQDLHEAEQLAHRLVVLRSGRVVANATATALKSAAGDRNLVIVLVDATDRTAALRTAERLAQSAVPDRDDDRTVRIPLGATGGLPGPYLAALATEGIAVADVRIDEPSLDDAVIGLTA